MIGKELISERYVTISHAKEIMTNKANVSELSYEHGCALDYLEKFAQLSAEDAENLVKELINLGLDEKTAIKIADILPDDEEDLKLIFYKSDIPKNSEEILDVVSQYK
ncbi:RNA polymerase Rpb4 family protein [Methanothermococcus okinawensis]|nr:RNA polymerase Rpb4 family protein [Methanothermococcus okinawensis]